MPDLLAQVAPQKSTQYSTMVEALVEPELRLSPLGPHIVSAEPLRLGGQTYVRLRLDGDLNDTLLAALGCMALSGAFFWLYDAIGEVAGPLLRPIETPLQEVLPRELVETRRYRGKTNELFTHFMCNICRHASAFGDTPWSELRLFDPLAGGGTTLFTGLMLGADVAGVEHTTRDVESTASYLQGFFKSEGIACRVKKERLRQVGQRWDFRIGRDGGQRCLLCAGDTLAADTLIAGFKPHLIVCDLPYGIQHKGALQTLIAEGMAVWSGLLRPGGAMALAWESSRFSREELSGWVEALPDLQVQSAPPYDALAHRVDRVIKRRDVLVVVKAR